MPRVAPAIVLNPATQSTLLRWIQNPASSAALVLRSRIVLQAAGGVSNQRIAAGLKVPQVTVGKWRRSFALKGLNGLRDAARSGRPRKHAADVRKRVQALARQRPPSQERWTVRALAREVNLPHSTVHSILQAGTGGKVHAAPKPADIAGIYLTRRAHAVVLCAYQEPSAGAVIARRRARSFLSFLNEVVRNYRERDLHVIADNPKFPKKPTGRRWLRRHPRVQWHYLPGHASWLNLAERFSSILAKPPGAKEQLAFYK